MDTAKDIIKPKDGIATFNGEVFYLVDKRAMIDKTSGQRIINAVSENAHQLDPGYLPMTLLVLSDTWKCGDEVLAAIPNGDYDWIMREQKGYLTPPRGYCGRRCHDC